jgi:hypothetical protein
MRENEYTTNANTMAPRMGNSSGCRRRLRSAALYCGSALARSLQPCTIHSTTAARTTTSATLNTTGLLTAPMARPATPTAPMSGHMLLPTGRCAAADVCCTPCSIAGTLPSRLK